MKAPVMKSECAMASLEQWVFNDQAEREKMSGAKKKMKERKRNGPGSCPR